MACDWNAFPLSSKSSPSIDWIPSGALTGHIQPLYANPLLLQQKRLPRTGTVRIRYFRSRAAYSANSDASRQRGRLAYVPPILLAGDVELNPGPNFGSQNTLETSVCRRSPAPSQYSCAACPSLSTRKNSINCDSCGQRWHTTCARITVAQASALNIWHCSDCRHSSASSRSLRASQEVRSQSHLLSPTPTTLSDRLAELRRTHTVIKRIPKAARAATADSLSKLIERAITNPSTETWEHFLSFAFRALRAPSKVPGEKHKTAASVIKKQIADLESNVPLVARQREPHSPTSDRQNSVARRVMSKCADGDIKAALRALTSNEEFIQPTSDTVTALRRKHPAAPPDENIPPPLQSQEAPPLRVQTAQVRSAIESMPTGSAAGLDGMRPLHLRQLISAEASEPGRRLLGSLTSLANKALEGDIPECARSAFFGATLCALRKKDGGLRPIAVGSVYRRLPCRIAARHAADLLGPEFRPVQLGVGTRLGCEAAVHAAREYISSVTDVPSPNVILKLDVRNAFNTVRRDKMLNNIKKRCPEVYRLAHQSYSAPTPLHIGEDVISSSCGVQQGDPLGPVGFSVAIDDCARSLKSPINIWYLDDATIAGPVDTVTDDLVNLQKMLPDLGLELNSSKCEFTLLGATSENARTSIAGRLKTALPEITETPLASLTLLGSPLAEDGIQASTDIASGTIHTLCDRIRELDTHTATFFLAHFISAPRLQYLLRSSPIYTKEAALQEIDDTVKSTLTDVCNVQLDSASWTQASLPMRYGGLGVRSVARLALPCYIASLNAAAPLIASIVPFMDSSAPSALQPALDFFRTSVNSSIVPELTEAGKQRTWDDIASEAYRDQLLTGADQTHRARLMAASQPHTAAWLQAIPVPNLGLLLDPESVRIAVALRLGAPICDPHKCLLCGRYVGPLGLHALSCKKSAGRFPRHAQLNDLVKRSLSAAGVPSLLEPVGLDRGDGKRPDGITTFPFASGKCLAWDATCTDTFSESAVVACALKPGSAARAAESRKIEKYASISTQYLFVPIAVETTGVIGPAASRFFRELGRRMVLATGDRREAAWVWQRVSMAIVRGNATSIRGSVVLSDSSIKHNHLCKEDVHAKSPDTQLAPRAAAPQTPRDPRQYASEVAVPESVGMAAVHHSVQPSRDPMDDPELARYLQPRATVRPIEPVPTTQELNDELLRITPSDPSDQTGSPRPNLLAGYAELLAELKAVSRCDESDDGERPSD